MRYASHTSVSVEKSRGEIEWVLKRYGAGNFGYLTKDGIAMIAFEAQNRRIRMIVPLPDPKDFERNKKGYERKAERALRSWEQACRQRWRALALVVKAKLECVESGVATFEQEFLPYTLLPDGKTVGDFMLPQVALAYQTGEMPPQMIGLPEKTKAREVSDGE